MSKEDAKAKADYMREYGRIKRAADPWHELRISMKKHYGITVEQYLEMHDKQGGVCAVCGCAESSVDPRTKRVRRLAVDHCHDTGKIRGLLCSSCNTAIGQMKDDVRILSSAISYLQKHSETVNRVDEFALQIE